jgi:hypothetical protein
MQFLLAPLDERAVILLLVALSDQLRRWEAILANSEVAGDPELCEAAERYVSDYAHLLDILTLGRFGERPLGQPH